MKHTKFGSGIVVAVEGNRIEVQFDYQGIKAVLDSFLDLIAPAVACSVHLEQRPTT